MGYYLTNCSVESNHTLWYHDGGKAIVAVMVAVRVLIAVAGIIGNSMVIYAALTKRNAMCASFRYLNRVVLSLAFADLFYSLLGQPFDILHWYASLSGLGPKLRRCGGMWIMSIMTFFQDVCSGASCIHVALILLLRCLCLMQPLRFEKWHLKISKIGIAGIWIYTITIVLIPTFISFMITKGLSDELYKKYKNPYSTAWTMVYQLTLTVPLVLNVILCIVQLYLIKKRDAKSNTNEEYESYDSGPPDIRISDHSNRKTKSVLQTNGINSRASRKKALARMIKIVTIGTIICYTPNLLFRSYLMQMVRHDTSYNTYDSTGKVVFAFFARVGLQLGSIINPFIYATTIPQFKKLVKRYMTFSLGMKTSETGSGAQTFTMPASYH